MDESWAIKKAEHRRNDAFELWYWTTLLRIPWRARRSNQSILKEISWIFIGRTDVEAETPILWPPDVKNWLIWKAPDSGKDRRREEKGTTDDENSVDMNLSGLGDVVRDWGAWCAAIYGVTKSWTWLSDWTKLRTKNFTIHMGTQKTPNSQSSLEKEWSWRNQPSWLQIILQSYSHQDSMVQAQK